MEVVFPSLDVCKICLQCTDESLVSLFDEESKETLGILFSCFQITFVYDKLKPSKICAHCVTELKNANNFRNKCLSVDERFQEYYARQVEVVCKIEPSVEDSDHGEFEETLEPFPQPNDNEDVNSKAQNLENKNSLPDINSAPNTVQDNFKCELCGKILKSHASLLKHNDSMHEKRKYMGEVSGFGTARRYHCTMCSYSTPHSQTLVNHMRRHNGERPYRCECGKTFTQTSSLAAHRKTHSNTTFFTCSECGKQFKHGFALKNHMIVHQTANFECDMCHKLLKSKLSLQSHMHRHYKVHNYNCEECGDTFVTSGELFNHRKKHNVKKNVECNLCGFKTNTKKVLIVHLRSHTGDKPFHCNICKMSFLTQSNLARHLHVHTREKPFSCTSCAQRYKYRPSLKKHMKDVHGVDFNWSKFKKDVFEKNTKLNQNTQ